MTDKDDQNDDIHSISRKFEEITTVGQSLNSRGMNSLKVERPPDQMTPLINHTPERIIFVVDTARENDCTPFEIGSGAKYPPLHMIKRVLEIFMNLKSTICKKHEFAIMKLMGSTVHWVCDFTDNLKTLMGHLERIEENQMDEDCRDFDLAPCFQLINDKIRVDYGPSADFVTRVVLIYSRSHCVPVMSDPQGFSRLMDSSHFFTDVIYVHERPDDDNNCEKVYERLGNLDTKGNSYIFEVARNPAYLHNTMAKLLAHPAQRPRQDATSYTPFCVPETEHSTV